METLIHCCWACKKVQLLWKTVWRFYKVLSIELLYDSELPYDLAIPLSMYSREMKTYIYILSSTNHNNKKSEKITN